MSHEIQLRPITSSFPAAPDELFGGGGMSGPGGAAQASPFQKVHRLLRGRYILAIFLALLGGAAGAVAGWYSQQAEYVSEGLIEIQPTIRSAMGEKTITYYDKFLNSQPQTIMSSRVIERAMETDVWKAALANHPSHAASFAGVEGVQRFKTNLVAGNKRNTQLVTVGFTALQPELAQSGVQAVIRAYQELYADATGQEQRNNLADLDKMISEKDAEIQRNRQLISDITKEFPTSAVQQIASGYTTKVQQYEGQLREAKIDLTAAEMAMSEKQDGKLPDYTPEEIAEVDETMRGMLAERINKQYLLDRLIQQKRGENHREMINARDELKLHDTYIEKYADGFRKTFAPPAGTFQQGGQAVPMTARELKRRQDQVAMLTQLHNEVKEQAQAANNTAHDVEDLTNKNLAAQAQLDKYEQRLEMSLQQAPSMAGIVRVVSAGENPEPAADRRIKFAAVGFVGGAALPILLFLVIGLMDHRYRYSEEATYDMSGVTLLGILPNLPDRLTDPEQAATAAHCVHQIRTMLQINGVADEPQVYAVTSAAAGDGKTSLSLALGLSFAASGSRTLLIDCDLVGAGLTARLDMAGPDGILEAMNDRSLLQHIRTTDIADLSILPVGMAQAHHAGMFSPAALRKLVTEAKKHFEIVLIDTGPILGSIEATPVCSAADAVILAVSRGQQRPTVEKAIKHLTSIGARFAGVVFNRAQAKDFERSISGMSLRSIARANGHGNGRGSGHSPFNTADTAATKAFGPVARAVASSVQNDDNNNG